MPITITEFKKQNPAYQNVDDKLLAKKIYDKFYTGKMEENDFYNKVGLSEPSSWKQTMQKRGADLADVVNRFQTGRQTLPETLYQGGLKSTFGTLADVVGEGISTITPEAVKQTLKPVGEYIAQQPMVQSAVEAFQNLSPRQQANIEATGLLPIGIMARTFTQLATPLAKGTKQLAEKGVEVAFPQKALPSELKSAQPLLDAKSPTFLRKSPNELKSGLQANKAISVQYGKDKSLVDEAYKLTRAEGNFPVLGTGIKKEFYKITNNMEGKVGLTGKEQTVLKKLNDIKTGIASGDSLTANELLDLRQAVNSVISKKGFFNEADAVVSSFKSTINKGIEKAGEYNPKFLANLQDADTKNIALNQVYKKNKSLKELWTPEDYKAFQMQEKAVKANKATPELPAETVGRANKFLKNLNTTDAGKIQAALQALPKSEAEKVMRDAYILAKKNKINITNAVRQILTGSPIQGTANLVKSVTTHLGEKAPLEQYAKELKQMRVPIKKETPITSEAPQQIIEPQKLLTTSEPQKQLPYFKGSGEFAAPSPEAAKYGALPEEIPSSEMNSLNYFRQDRINKGLPEAKNAPYNALKKELQNRLGQSELGKKIIENPYATLEGRNAVKEIVYKEFNASKVAQLQKNKMIATLVKAQNSKLTPKQRESAFKDAKFLAKKNKMENWENLLNDIESNPNASFLGKGIVKALKEPVTAKPASEATKKAVKNLPNMLK